MVRTSDQHGERETGRGGVIRLALCRLLEGSWDTALHTATELVDELQGAGNLYDLIAARMIVVQIRGRRGYMARRTPM